MRRPLLTGDDHDAQLEVGGASAGMAIAYWDPDSAPKVGRMTAMSRAPTRAGSR